MTRPRAFMLIAFINCLAVMLVGFWLLFQDDAVAQVAGLVLVEAAFVFGLWYGLIAPGRRRTVKRLTVTDGDDMTHDEFMTIFQSELRQLREHDEVHYDPNSGYWLKVRANGHAGTDGNEEG